MCVCVSIAMNKSAKKLLNIVLNAKKKENTQESFTQYKHGKVMYSLPAIIPSFSATKFKMQHLNLRFIKPLYFNFNKICCLLQDQQCLFFTFYFWLSIITFIQVGFSFKYRNLTIKNAVLKLQRLNCIYKKSLFKIKTDSISAKD